MGDLSNTWFFGAPYHPIIMEVSIWTWYFQPCMWKPRGLPLGEIDACRLVHVLGVHLEKEALVFEDTLVLFMPVMELHIEWNQLEDEATLYSTLVATSESSPLLNSKYSHRLFVNMCCANLWWSGHDFSQFWRWILWFQESCITGLHRQRETPFHCQSHFGQLGRSFLTLALMLVRYISRLQCCPKLVSYVIPCIVYSRNTAVPRWFRRFSNKIYIKKELWDLLEFLKI